MHHDHTAPADGSRQWRTAEGTHLDLRGLPADEPRDTVLRAIETGTDSALIGHFDAEPIWLYPELDERGWTHEIMDSHCGSDCEGGFMLRMVRWGA